MMVYETWKPEDTYELGRKMGQEAVPGQIVCLNGDLGVGKTVFTQGFAQGLGIDVLCLWAARQGLRPLPAWGTL